MATSWPANELKRNQCGDGRDHQVHLVGSPEQLWIATAATKQAPSRSGFQLNHTREKTIMICTITPTNAEPRVVHSKKSEDPVGDGLSKVITSVRSSSLDKERKYK
ncbi:hypothetical protein VNO77_27349 [Canavalia gladiata]|uniref:Uncharacterized protein n=1 Tax=Canavalia gladiata TaxID=3824 RepID=A0AAN9QAF3_CANGL